MFVPRSHPDLISHTLACLEKAAQGPGIDHRPQPAFGDVAGDDPAAGRRDAILERLRERAVFRPPLEIEGAPPPYDSPELPDLPPTAEELAVWREADVAPDRKAPHNFSSFIKLKTLDPRSAEAYDLEHSRLPLEARGMPNPQAMAHGYYGPGTSDAARMMRFKRLRRKLKIPYVPGDWAAEKERARRITSTYHQGLYKRLFGTPGRRGRPGVPPTGPLDSDFDI